VADVSTSEPIVIDLPGGESIEVNNSHWTEIASSDWNRLRDDGFVQWTQTICRDEDGRILVYVVLLPTSGILKTAGEILPAGVDVTDAVERLAQRFDVPSNVPYSCIQRYRRALRESR
jgi:hypothetical protein